jgi:dihydroorotate dehydrogenase electron transfer subunit
MSVSSPTAVGRNAFDFSVRANVSLCREHFRLTLLAPQFPHTKPGQFVQVLCADDDGQSNFGGAMLRRPFSLAGRRDVSDGVEIDLIARIVGVGTRYLSQLRVGETVNVLGPLGNAFELPPAGGVALLVGGGVGIPPMIYLAEAIAQARGEGNPRAVVFAGAMTKDLMALTVTNNAAPGKPTSAHAAVEPLYNVAEFAAHNIPALLSTDDGTLGRRGFVTDTLRDYLDAYLTDNADRAKAVIYTCGPEGMLKAVAEIAHRRQISCQVCVERAMACGLGTSQSCVIKVKKPDPAVPPLAGSDWCYRLACTDGPVFEASTLLW